MRAYLGALNDHDPDRVAEFVAPDFVNEHTSARSTSVAGRDTYRARLDEFLATFVGLRYDIEDLIANGSRVAVAYRMRATVDDKPIDIRGMFRFVVTGGLIAHRTDYWDGEVFKQQLEQGKDKGENP